MKTYTAKAGEVEQGWYVVDAQDKVLGKLATQIAAAESSALPASVGAVASSGCTPRTTRS